MPSCRTCKYYRIGSQECTNEDFVRKNLVEVSGWGEMRVDEMMDGNICDTFGTPPGYYCGYFELKDEE